MLHRLKEHKSKKARSDSAIYSEYERYIHEDFITYLQTNDFAGFDVLGFWKSKESMFPVLSRIAMDVLSALDFEEEILTIEVQDNEATPLSDEEITLDAASQGTMASEVIVISSSDEDLSSDEKIVLMGDIQFSDADDEQPQATSTSRRYRKISMSGYVLFLIASDAPTPVDQYVRKPIKGHVKVTSCVLALRVVIAPDVDVGSSNTRRKSSLDICDLNVLQEMKLGEVGNEVK
ncbi:zinc finger BED domain-containing protein RICESLEEPER 2-like protein [Tanacetum coccineum]